MNIASFTLALHAALGRLFTILTDPSKVELQFDGVDALHRLYHKPSLSAEALFCAPEDCHT